MKKHLFCVTALLLCLGLAACGPTADVSDEPDSSDDDIGTATALYETDWLTFGENGTVLNVCLPANATTGYQWLWDIDNGDLLALLSEEYLPDDPDGTLCGAGGTYRASFGCQKDDANGSVTLKLSYARPFENKIPEDVRTVTLLVEPGRKLSVQNIRIQTL